MKEKLDQFTALAEKQVTYIHQLDNIMARMVRENSDRSVQLAWYGAMSTDERVHEWTTNSQTRIANQFEQYAEVITLSTTNYSTTITLLIETIEKMQANNIELKVKNVIYQQLLKHKEG